MKYNFDHYQHEMIGTAVGIFVGCIGTAILTGVPFDLFNCIMGMVYGSSLIGGYLVLYNNIKNWIKVKFT